MFSNQLIKNEKLKTPITVKKEKNLKQLKKPVFLSETQQIYCFAEIIVNHLFKTYDHG